MKRPAGYAAAHEHALAGRYREARDLLERLLQQEPSHVEALLLLGKVEHYLRRHTRSRRCFETALTCDPSNPAAFFGIEHYRGRRRAALLVACAVLLAMLAGLTAALTRRSITQLRDSTAQIRVAVEGLSQSVGEVARAVEETGDQVAELRLSIRDEADAGRRSAAEICSELARIRNEVEALAGGLEEVRRAVERRPGRPEAR